MRFPSRVNGAHGTLAFLELAAVPVSVLATFLVLLLAAGAAALTRRIGALLAIGSTATDVLVGAVVVLTAVALVAAGGLAVIGYQRFFDRSFRDLDPLPLLVVPLLGIVGPVAYAVFVLETRALPWWLFVIVLLSAHAFALRSIAIYSMLDRRRRTGVLVGVVAGITAVVAQVHVVTTEFLDGAGDEIAIALLGTVTESWIPRERWLLVVVPLLVATLYGIHRLDVTDGWWELPDRLRGRPRDLSIRRATDRLPSRSPGQSVRDAVGRLRDRSAATSDSRGQSVPSPPSGGGRVAARPPASGAGSSSPPPSSPSPGRSRERRDSTSSEKSAFRGGSDSADAESASSSGADSGRDPERDADADGSSSTGSASGDDASNEGGSGSTGGAASSADGRSSTGTADDAKDEGTTDGEATGGTGSDTRIFVDDWGQYGNDGTSVETCPACEDEIPSDGVYKFCPFCGHEL